MQIPMIGNWTIEVHAVRPYTIHGDLYYEVNAARTDDPAKSLFVLRMPQHATESQPVAGQKLNVSFLMGQVTAAHPI